MQCDNERCRKRTLVKYPNGRCPDCIGNTTEGRRMIRAMERSSRTKIITPFEMLNRAEG